MNKLQGYNLHGFMAKMPKNLIKVGLFAYFRSFFNQFNPDYA